MVSKEEVKDLDNLCLRDSIYDCCKHKNSGRDHSFKKEVRDGTCDKHPFSVPASTKENEDTHANVMSSSERIAGR